MTGSAPASGRRADSGQRQDGRLLALTGQAGYEWDIGTDRIRWSENFAGLVGLAEGASHTTGRAFEKIIQAEGSESRFGQVHAMTGAVDPGAAIPYQCVYAISAGHVRSREPVWLEDTGVWHADENGRPVCAEGVVRVISERRKREDRLRRKSDFDDLTGLPNRRFFEARIGECLNACLDDDETAAILVVGLDRVDLINEFYGLPVADELIRECGRRIAARLRGDDVVARFSGAKFGVVLRNCADHEVYTASRRFLDTLQQDVIETSGGPVSLSAAVGACLVPRHARTVREAVVAASDACRLARRENGYRIGIHEPDPLATKRQRADAKRATAIAQACEAGRFALAFQPVVESSSGRIGFHECLARLAGEPGADAANELDGAAIVPIAEKLGFIRTLDHRSLELALQTLARHETASLSLNVSNETAQDPLWLSRLANGVNSITGAPARLIVEITESHAAGDLDEARKFVSIIRSLGCRVAIDDFGAGFTSFANLKALPVDIIKIDGSFAGNLAGDHANQVFIQSLLAIAGAFDVKTVVEWVEDRHTANLLAGWGVDYLQGHLFGPATTTPRFSYAREMPKEGGLQLAG